ncbi:toast rack family protein [Pontibacillus yanchengensis]|uniref:DUF2154 domain-containing protein n=1 Tax=Pontibacillus yanchengensis Y32 TaxID=1385514 RepID=A0A0A2T4Z2_9BACI|nr:toast rack family protein [Pontibacillus yanchengensis]KGP70832.1 hypothetical protein N782_04175 [Pontibacillus yanchengensis Y32]
MKPIRLLSAWVVLGMVLTGCNISLGKSGEVEKSEIIVDQDEAKQLDVELHLGAGKLLVDSGTDKWVEGSIMYSSTKNKPQISYQLNNGTGQVEIKDSKNVDLNIGDKVNEWEVNLTKEVPIKLNVNTGASDTSLNLSGLNLSDLSIHTGVGEMDVDLSGNWKESFDVELNTGVGDTHVVLPKDVGVIIESSKGIGESNFVDLISKGDGVYVNEAYDTSDVIISIQTEMGVGEATFEIE